MEHTFNNNNNNKIKIKRTKSDQFGVEACKQFKVFLIFINDN